MNTEPISTVSFTKVDHKLRLVCTQRIPKPTSAIFPFFASANNLERLTPDFLRFSVHKAPASLDTGSLIDYRLRLHGIPLRWRSRIDEWDPPRRFVDVQISGPFRSWHHVHEFEPLGSDTLIKDTVTFDLYGRFLYRTPVLSWIKSDLHRIFEYRHREIERIFSNEEGD